MFLLSEPESQTGIYFLRDYLVEEKGFSIDMLRTLVVKYPPSLSKSKEAFEDYFSFLQENGIEKDEAFYYLLEIPKLLS
jgi:hypothetical protein